MPRRPDSLSPEAVEAFEDVKRNIEDRLNVLGISPYRASVGTGHNQTWITDGLRRSAWVSLAWIVDIGKALNVPGHHLLLTEKKFKASSYSSPRWLEAFERDRESAG